LRQSRNNSKFKTQNSKLRQPPQQFKIQNSKFKIAAAAATIQNSKLKIQNSKSVERKNSFSPRFLSYFT